MRFELTKPDDYRRAKENAPIAYVPWGAHEWHGVQNPLGLDTLKAHGQCMALCAETGGVVFPPVYCGTATMKPYAKFDCTLEFSQAVLHLLAREYLYQLADEGFKVIVIVMGHYSQEQMDVIREEAAKFNEMQDKAVAWAFPDFEPTAADGFPCEHAACYETSYMMWFHPELVDMARLPQDRDLDFSVDGIAGQDPRGCASAKKGRDGTDSLVKNVAPRVLELLQQKLI